MEGFTEYKLANGLTVLLFPDASKPTTVVNVTYRVGSAHENYGETGMAHLLEHLVFKGTPNRGNIMQELGRRGMHFNGSTSWERTNYFETFTAGSENLDWALSMEADRMVNSYIRRSDLDTEMTVVRNEFESGENNPQLVLFGKMLATAYQWHNYGHLQIGARSDIENVDIARLQALLQALLPARQRGAHRRRQVRCRPDPRADRQVFRPRSPSRRAPCPASTRRSRCRTASASATLRRVGNSKFLGMMFHTPRGADPDSVATDVLGDVLTIAPSGRLYKALVETKKATSVQYWGDAQVDPFVMTLFRADSRRRADRARAREAMLATLANIAKEPITEAEVARVRAKNAKGYDDILANPQALAVAISESIALGDWRMFFSPARPLSHGDACRRPACRARVSQALQHDGRRIPARRQARSRAAASGRGCGRNGEGLQGRRHRHRRRDVRPVAGPISMHARNASPLRTA